MLWQLLTPIFSDLPVRHQNTGKSYFAFKRINILNQRVLSFVQGERFKVSCAPTAPIGHCGNYIGKVASVSVGFQPVNIASLVSKSI